MEKTQTVVTPLLNVTFNHEEESTCQALGIPEKRGEEITDWITNYVHEEGQSKSRDIEAILNHFDKPNELAYALFALNPLENQVSEEEAFKGEGFPGLEETM